MSVDRIYLRRAARNIEESPEYEPFSKVRIIVGQDEQGNQLVYEAGEDTWRTLEIENPWGTQAMADAIYSRVKGYAYKPYRADGAILNPAAELGDAVSVGEVYSFIAEAETSFTSLMTASISAPEDSDIDHEYPYETKESREVSRRINGVKTSFIVELGRIRAEISDTYQTKSEAGIQYETLSNSITATASGITTEVSRTYETKLDATSKLNEAKQDSSDKLTEAKNYTDNVSGSLTTLIEVTAGNIKSTVASSESKYALPTGITFSLYGYGAPTNATAVGRNGQYYLDQSSGYYYRSNGSVWSRVSNTPLRLITDTLQSSINQLPDSILLTVSLTYATQNAVSTVEQTANKINWLVSGDSQSTMTLTDKAISLVSGTIDLSGFVTFHSLETSGESSINGANIITGSITADKIVTTNLLVQTVYGSMFEDRPWLNQVILSTDGSIIRLGSWGYSNPDYNEISITANESVIIGEGTFVGDINVEFDIRNKKIIPTYTLLASWELGTSSNPFANVATEGLLLHNRSRGSIQFSLTSGTGGYSSSLAIYPESGEFDIGTSSRRIYGIFTQNLDTQKLNVSTKLTTTDADLGAAQYSTVNICTYSYSTTNIGTGSSAQVNIGTGMSAQVNIGTYTSAQVNIGTGLSGKITIGANNSSSYATQLAFFGATPIAKQTLSTSSNDTGYTTITSSNLNTTGVYALNNLIGILKNKYGLIG